MFANRLLRFFSISLIGLLVFILLAVVGLFVYEPSPAEGFAFSLTCASPTIFPGEGHTVLYYRYNEIIQAMLKTWK